MNVQRISLADRSDGRGLVLVRSLAGALLGASLMLPVLVARADSQQGDNAPQLEGTWKYTVVPPVTFVPAHLAFVSFAPAGVMIGSPDIYLPPPFVRMDTAQGTWQKAGGQEFTSTMVAYGYNASGQAVGILKFNARYRLIDKDSFEASGQLVVCNLSLQCAAAGPGSATLHATRLGVEPLVNP